MSIPNVAADLAAKYDLSRTESLAIVRCVLDAVVERAVGAEGVSLHGFGTFKIKDRGARKGRNPQTGESVAVAASRRLTFKQARSIKDRLNVSRASAAKGKAKAKKAAAPAAPKAPRATAARGSRKA